jgi:hypothetical protein
MPTVSSLSLLAIARDRGDLPSIAHMAVWHEIGLGTIGAFGECNRPGRIVAIPTKIGETESIQSSVGSTAQSVNFHQLLFERHRLDPGSNERHCSALPLKADNHQTSPMLSS